MYSAAPIHQEKHIKNRVYRQCAIDGFNARLKAELKREVPANPPLHSHHTTRQSYFNKGWYAVTYMDIARIKAKYAANQAHHQKHPTRPIATKAQGGQA